MWFMVYGLKFMVQCKHLCKPSWVSPQFERSRSEREGREGRAEAIASTPHMHVTAPTPPPSPLTHTCVMGLLLMFSCSSVTRHAYTSNHASHDASRVTWRVT